MEISSLFRFLETDSNFLVCQYEGIAKQCCNYTLSKEEVRISGS
jgi:hypothetical protein